jgi:small-conductance mechanosensitive channel
MPLARRFRHRAALLIASCALAAVAPAPSAHAQLPGGVLSKGAATPAERPVPQVGALQSGWWDYLAPAEPGFGERAARLLARAGESAAQLPAADADRATRALERLRISLDALPDMIAAAPASPPELPAAATSYTPSAILRLDRQVRDVQFDLDERRSAIAVAERAISDGGRQLDRAFTTYLAEPADSPERVLAGLELMAARSELELAMAEQKLRRAESEGLAARLREFAELRQRGVRLIVPDPGRDEARVRALVAGNRAKLEAQREKVLRLRAARSKLGSRPDGGQGAVELADLRLTAAMLEERLLIARIALQETELDWLAIARGGLDTAGVAAVDRRIAERRRDLQAAEAEIGDWVGSVETQVAAALRTPKDELAPDVAAARAGVLELAPDVITRIIRLRGLLADVRFGCDVTEDLLAEKAGWRGWLRSRVIGPGTALLARADDLLGRGLFRIGDAPVTVYGLLRVALFLVIAVGLSRLLRHLLERVGARQAGRPSAALYTVSRLAHYVLVIAALLVGLASIGLDFSQIALVAGALSIGIGFGLQSIVNNFVSGLMILFEQNLKVGDAVELDSGVRGVVKEINVRSTLISTSDAIDVVVPNAEFISGKVTNFTLKEPVYRIHVPFGVAYGSDKEQVRRVIVEAADRVPFTHRGPGRETDVWLVRFGDNSLDFELVVWINPGAVPRPGAVTATYLWEIETALAAHGIPIPFPQRDVRLRVAPAEGPAIARELTGGT